ncbi:MAG: hypothetical protein J7623_19150 [Chitinophaga sp.]|uniref:hypothetical protein n=1 Tax=Chitinophaga sp. TaxID=1869181 RepID=UPI001B0C624C|nr:hypothetical protein [Chitinophaga sp.]MBO9730766.1 hypothetical protein [Chitinophaga sp.]
MESHVAKQIGGKIVLKAQLIAILSLYFLWMLIVTVPGDFANNIIFFIADQMHPLVLLFFILLLGMSYLLGRRAGTDILMKSRGTAITVIKYALAMSLLMLFYLLGAYFLFNGSRAGWNIVLWPAFLTAVTIVLAWVWAIKKLELRKKV